MENIVSAIEYLNKNSFVQAILLLIIGSFAPYLWKKICFLFKKKKDELIITCGIFNILQEKIDISSSELQSLIDACDRVIGRMEVIDLKGKVTTDWLKDQKKMYLGQLNAKDGVAHIDDILQIKIIPRDDNKNYKITNIIFRYDYKKNIEKIYDFFSFKKRTHSMIMLPTDFHSLYQEKIFNRVDPLIIRYSVLDGFKERYLNKNLIEIIITDSADQSWSVSGYELKRIIS